MNALAAKLGLSTDLAFYDVWSLDDQDLLSHIPRPAVALLVIIPMTKAWKAERDAEDSKLADYEGSGPQEPVVWFKQTIAKEKIMPGSTLEAIRAAAVPLKMAERAQMLYDNQAFEDAHKECANMGDTVAPEGEEGHHVGQHFVAFVKESDGHLWELEGSRKGPIDRGQLAEEDDVLSPKALEFGLKRVINLQREADGDLRFSCIALAPRTV
jgi:ubiquitin carboxyl-terminal hydrolase L3